MNTAENKALWQARAALGEKAGTQDLIAKRIEQRALLKALRQSGAGRQTYVLEVGCGRGETARLVAERFGCQVTAIDNSSAMLDGPRLDQGVRFRCCEIDAIAWDRFDIVYTQRMLVNIPTESQYAMLEKLARRLRPKGRLILCECSVNGWGEINKARIRSGLPKYDPPPHTHYLVDDVMRHYVPSSLRFVKCWGFSHLYYLCSRLINASWAKGWQQEPSYDAWINKLALALPLIEGPLAQVKIYVYERV